MNVALFIWIQEGRRMSDDVHHYDCLFLRNDFTLRESALQDIGWGQVKGSWVEVKGVTRDFSISIEFSSLS